MAERGSKVMKRVFINNLDSYASKHIAKSLSSCVVGASPLADGESEDEEVTTSESDQASTFHEPTPSESDQEARMSQKLTTTESDHARMSQKLIPSESDQARMSQKLTTTESDQEPRMFQKPTTPESDHKASMFQKPTTPESDHKASMSQKLTTPESYHKASMFQKPTTTESDQATMFQKLTPSESDQEASMFQIVGTVSSPGEKAPHVLEEYYQLQQEELLHRLMACDVIIYNVTQHADQVDEASWAVAALSREVDRFSGPKTFILISTVMTWALSKPLDPDDPEIPFSDEDYRRRRAHPNFKQHVDLERLVVKMGKMSRPVFTTYVVAAGLLYGMGEQLFDLFFKMSWLGREAAIPVFGDGSNLVPTIHVEDLASVVQKVIVLTPAPCYLLAVDAAHNTMEDIVQAIASVLGPGEVHKRPFGDAFLIEDLTQMDIDSMSVNLYMEAVHVKDLLAVRWVCEEGLVENIELLVEQFKETRGLRPVRLCILGPPAVGKSTLAERICRHYRLNHVRLKDVISETMAHLEAVSRAAELDAESEASSVEEQVFLDTLRDNMEQNGGRLDDELVIRLMKDKLLSKPCRNQGFVLDAFPKTYDQAKELFYAEEDESEDSRSTVVPDNKSIALDFLFVLDASDAFLKERVLNLPESVVEGSTYRQDVFPRRLATYRENNAEDETVLNYFDELGVDPRRIEITDDRDLDYLLATQQIIQEVGPPRNYGPSGVEAEEEERRRTSENTGQRARERAEAERREAEAAEEAEQRAARWAEWSKRLEEAQERAGKLLEAESLPLRGYLVRQVMPTLTQGLVACCNAQPADPLDFLAEYLFRHNPLND